MKKIFSRFLTQLGNISDQELAAFSIEIVGDIAILKMPQMLKSRGKAIGTAMLKHMPQVKVILAQKGPITGDFRVREVEHIAGETRTVTMHREFGCSFLVDLSKAYFSPRLSTERSRIAHLVAPGESVLNMFAGVGPFSILIARKQPQCRIVEIELNPSAHALAKENARLNKVAARIEHIQGESRQVVEGMGQKFSRVLMPLPETSFEFLECAIKSIAEQGGWIHLYTHVHGRSTSEAIQSARTTVDESLRGRGSMQQSRIVKGIGPGWYQIVSDLEIYPT